MITCYQCPVCKTQLKREQHDYSCDNNHRFDIAKEGYVNLLLANQMNSKAPGDSKEMMRARRDFLNNGYYDQLITLLVSIISESTCTSPSIIDAGCGDGYYLHSIKQQILSHTELSPKWLGTDISKEAVKMAAKRDKEIEFAVASSFRLPVQPDSIDYMLRVFAPGDDAEIVRCLKPGGTFILVTPGPNHLHELKEVIYKTPRLHDQTDKQIQNLTLKYRESICYTLNLTKKDDVRNLLTMTPYYWNGDREVKSKFDAMTALTTQIDFTISVYQK